MRAQNLTYEQLGSRLDVSPTTMWRWAKEQWRLRPGKTDAIADALGLKAVDLHRPPNKRKSIDARLEDADDNVYDAVLQFVERLTSKAS